MVRGGPLERLWDTRSATRRAGCKMTHGACPSFESWSRTFVASHATVRASTVLNRMLDLPGVTVAGVSFPAERPLLVVVEVKLRRWRLTCPHCG